MKLRKHLKGMIIGLSIEFVLGVIVTFYGVPPEERSATNPEPWFAMVAIMIHAPLGLLMIFGAIYTYYSSLKSGVTEWKKYGLYCLVSILITVGAGVLTVTTGEKYGELGPAVMAIGFLLSILSYFYYYTMSGQIQNTSVPKV